MFRPIRTAYTLIELLVVVAIMALIYSMIIIVPEETINDRLHAAAQELQATFLQARSLAMRTNEVHAVTFHIQNANEGHVFKNRTIMTNEGLNDATGGHWYAIIGPDKTGNTNSKSYIPMLDRDYNETNRAKLYRTLDDFIEGMQASQVGQKHFLPPGVRFLALSDLDEGHRYILDYEAAWWPAKGCGPTFPRPWYGYYDNGRLHAWGGYDPALDDAHNSDYPISGLCFEGHDAGNFAYNLDADTILDGNRTYGRFDQFDLPKNNTDSQTPTNSRDGQPRAVVNGYWGDVMILFMPDGHAYFTTCHTRIRMFEKAQWNNNRIISRGGMRISHEDNNTGGYHITLARDVDPEDPIYTQHNTSTNQPEYHLFDSAEDAYQSIRPFLRVFVNRKTGAVSIKDESHPHCQINETTMSSKDPYPLTP